jgi:hypothetical protein
MQREKLTTSDNRHLYFPVWCALRSSRAEPPGPLTAETVAGPCSKQGTVVSRIGLVPQYSSFLSIPRLTSLHVSIVSGSGTENYWSFPHFALLDRFLKAERRLRPSGCWLPGSRHPFPNNLKVSESPRTSRLNRAVLQI